MGRISFTETPTKPSKRCFEWLLSIESSQHYNGNGYTKRIPGHQGTYPQAEIDKLFAALRNVTQGKAKLKSPFAEYAPVPAEMQKKLSESYKEDLSV